MAPKISVTLPESGDPMVAPSIWVKNLEPNSAELEDIVIFKASRIHSVDCDLNGLKLSRFSTVCRHFSMSQLGYNFAIYLVISNVELASLTYLDLLCTVENG